MDGLLPSGNEWYQQGIGTARNTGFLGRAMYGKRICESTLLRKERMILPTSGSTRWQNGLGRSLQIGSHVETRKQKAESADG